MARMTSQGMQDLEIVSGCCVNICMQLWQFNSGPATAGSSGLITGLQIYMEMMSTFLHELYIAPLCDVIQSPFMFCTRPEVNKHSKLLLLKLKHTTFNTTARLHSDYKFALLTICTHAIKIYRQQLTLILSMISFECDIIVKVASLQ